MPNRRKRVCRAFKRKSTTDTSVTAASMYVLGSLTRTKDANVCLGYLWSTFSMSELRWFWLLFHVQAHIRQNSFRSFMEPLWATSSLSEFRILILFEFRTALVSTIFIWFMRISPLPLICSPTVTLSFNEDSQNSLFWSETTSNWHRLNAKQMFFPSICSVTNNSLVKILTYYTYWLLSNTRRPLLYALVCHSLTLYWDILLRLWRFQCDNE